MSNTTQEEYIETRNSFIPSAEAMANAKVIALGKTECQVVGIDGVLFAWDYFSQFFHEEMNRLTKKYIK